MSSERLTVPALIARWAGEQPDRQFLVADDATLTYGDLERATRDAAARCAANGVVKASRVGVLMPNSASWAVAALGLARIGAVVVPLSTLLRPPELEAQLRTAAVERLLVVPEFRGRHYLDDLRAISDGLVPDRAPIFDRAVPRLRAIEIWQSPPAAAPADASIADALAAAVRPADDLAIIFTSGSRGAPKGVIHTHGGALGATAAGLEARCVTRDDRLYIPMPFFWVGGFGTGLLSVLVAGATLVSEAQPEPARTLRLLQDERVTLFRGWPDQAETLAAHPAFASTDLSRLRPGSLQAVLPAPAAPGRRAGLLGMTETFGPYCGDRLDRDLPEGKEGSCGRPFAGVEVRIVDPDTGDALPAGELGEIHVRGPNLMRGICGRTRGEVFTADGFFATGDLGVLDPDGYLFFRGRRDDMFKVKGASVYPSEVEAALRAIPEVERAVVVDVVDDGITAVGALVALRPGSQCSVDELAASTRARLSAFKVPTRWTLRSADEIPTTATGKIDHDAVRRILTEPG
ncbi:MAG TPA: class I adenylate-forming enzyme family protein [Acidimicrobiia bacterium]|nr:class I adenylate-forming enzyme family protein [Acidimicrobiia bacterium]